MADPGGLVLIVEDNEDNRLIYRAALEHAGFRVIEAVDGFDGVALAREKRPEIVLMDISMPNVDGWEATFTLKSDPSTRSMPVIALTSHVLAAERERIRRGGFDGYLAKPVLPRVVVEEVKRVLAGGTGTFFDPRGSTEAEQPDP